MSDRQIIVVIVAVALVVAAVLLGRFLQRRRRQAWKRFAARHRLRVVSARDEAQEFSGTVGDRTVTLRQIDRGSDTGALGVAVVRVDVGLSGELPAGLRVEPGTPLDPLLIPETDDEPAELVSTDDEDFDARVRVRALDPAAARSYLTSERRRAIVRLLDEYPSAYSGIRHGRVQVAMREVVARAERLEGCLQQLLLVAPVLDAG